MTEGNAKSAADSSVSDASAAAATKLVDMLTNRLDSMQTDLKKAMDDIVSTSRSAQQTSQMGAISTKQDVGADESQSAGVSLASGNERSIDNFVAWQAARFADRDRTHFDNMQSLTALAFSNVTFALGLCQNLAAVDSHQQCGRNATARTTGPDIAISEVLRQAHAAK